jgi:Thioesterase-like superfamily
MAATKKVHFTTEIAAPPSKVYELLTSDASYREWTAAFCQGSYYEGSWQPGERIRFLSPSGGGVVAQVAENRPQEFISLKHLGIIKDGVEDTESEAVRAWAPAYENYRLTATSTGTILTVDQDVTAEHVGAMLQTWPKALALLKAICERQPSAAFLLNAEGVPLATELTRGPWDPTHQHAGPPTAMACRAFELAGAPHGLTHVARLTANLIRPIAMGELHIEVAADYVGKSAGHFSARVINAGKEAMRLTALLQRELNIPVPAEALGHPLPPPPLSVAEALPVSMPFKNPQRVGYADLVANRSRDGRTFKGPCTVWFKLLHPLVLGEAPSPYQRVMVAADSGNGVSAALDFHKWTFVNSDLTVNLLRRPQGEWICLDARTELGGNGCGLAESALYDEVGLIGRATQSLVVRPRAGA